MAREEQPDGVLLRASHDGYADLFNVVHQRVLVLSTDGRRLDGEDLFTPASGQAIPADRDQFAVRFHLHPSIKANRVADGHGAMLLLPNKEVWTFNAYDDRVDLEESVYLAGPDGPRRTAADSSSTAAPARSCACNGRFAAQAAAGTAAARPRRPREDEPQLPL